MPYSLMPLDKTRMVAFLEKYAGSPSKLLLERLMERHNMGGLNNADPELICEAILEDILSPMLSPAKLALARSELYAIFEVLKQPGIMEYMDARRVLPPDIGKTIIEHYKNISEFTLKQLMRKYNVPEISKIDSKTRVQIINAFIETHFGISGTHLFSQWLRDNNIVLNEQSSNQDRLMAMEYILQDLLQYYVPPVSARYLRSELVALLAIELESAQGPKPNDSVLSRRPKSGLSSPASRALRLAHTDLMAFLVKRESSNVGARAMCELPDQKKSRIAQIVLEIMLGKMAQHILSNLTVADPKLRLEYMKRYYARHLSHVMLSDDAKITLDMFRREFNLA
jgi:hypothetical protein